MFRWRTHTYKQHYLLSITRCGCRGEVSASQVQFLLDFHDERKLCTDEPRYQLFRFSVAKDKLALVHLNAIWALFRSNLLDD